jgi:hypothetical protein
MLPLIKFKVFIFLKLVETVFMVFFKRLTRHFWGRSENNNGRYSPHEYFRYSSDCCLWFDD